MAVMLFHGGVPGFSGGFVGVDVFFVISGYLITGILLRELASDTFSIGRFYERRIRRILPALFVVVLLCTPFAWVLMDPYAFWRFGQGLMAVTAFVSNILFWRTTNYFTATQDNPLLHTWSLGVEEQFYILFPLFLWLVWRFSRRGLLLAILVFALVSLGISQWGVQTGRVVAAFYLSPSRAYELLIGSVVAVLASRRVISDQGIWAASMAWLGMLLIGWAIFGFDQATAFPGWYALVPALGAALTLAFVHGDSILGRLLSLRGLVGIGLISYSAYLWHQPVFSFAHIGDWRPNLLGSLALVALSLVLAVMSWRYVEQPFRDRSFLTRRAVFGWAVVASCCVFGFGTWVHVTNGVSSRFTTEEMAWWRYGDISLQSRYVTDRFDSLARPFADDDRRKVLVLGDSYAQDFINMVYESGSWQDAQVRTVYIPVVCQLTEVNEDVSQYIASIDRPKCAHQPTLRSLTRLISQADIVVLASNWAAWSAYLLPRTIVNMGLREDQKLFIIGSKNFSIVNIRQLFTMGPSARAEAHHAVAESISEINAFMKRELPVNVFIDQIRIICGADEQCPVVTDEDHLISYDGGHLTQEGAKYIGERIFAESALNGVR